MDPFDQKIRNYAHSEPIAVPYGFDGRIEKIVANLSARKINKRFPTKTLLIASIFLLLSAITVMASPSVKQMAEGVISYFNAPQEFRYLSQRAQFEKYNNAIGATVQDQDIILKIDNIAIDDSYINVFYTIKSSSPIMLKGQEENPLTWRLQWTAPDLWFKADGRFINFPAQIEKEAYLENENTLKGMQRFSLVQSLPDSFNLEIYTSRIFDVQGSWFIPLDVDKSNAQGDTLVATPGIKAIVTSGPDHKYTHNITVDKVTISPFGNRITLTEMVKDCRVFSDFALKDDQGHYLDIVPSQLFAGNENKTVRTTNSFEFLGGNKGMKELTLIPLSFGTNEKGTQKLGMVSAPITNSPIRLQQSEVGAVVIDKIDLNEKELKITFHSDGILPSAHFILLDENDQDLNLSGLKIAVDENFDRQTGQRIKTFTFGNSPKEKIAQIKRIGLITYDTLPNTEEQVVIPLH
jgi:hypothetical protein